VINVLLVAVDPQLADRVSALREHRVVAIDRDNAAEMARINKSGPVFNPDVILIGADVSVDQAIGYAATVMAEHPAITVFLVAEPSRKLNRRAAKAGIQGVVPPSIGDQELAGLIRAGVPDSVRTPHQVVVVASPKGGVGKTTTAVNLAAIFAETSPRKVVLIDLDLQFGDVASMLDIEPEHSITDAFAADGIDSMLVRSMLAVHPAGFYVLAGSPAPADNAAVSGDQIRKLISQLSASFPYVVIDTSAGLLEETLSSLEEATDLVLVAALDIATLRSVRKEIDVLDDLELLPAARHVVLNKSDRRSGLSVRDAENLLGLPVHAVVPFSENVALAANHGELAVAKRKRSTVRTSFEMLARRVSDSSVEQNSY